MKKRNSIFFDREERRKENRRLSRIKSKLSFSREMALIKFSKRNTLKIPKKKEKEKIDINIKYLKIIRRTLEKYSKNLKEIFDNKIIGNLFNKNSCYHVRYKEMLIYAENTDFLHKYYDIKTSMNKIKNFGMITDKFNKFLPNFLGMGFTIYNCMNKYFFFKQDLVNRIENYKKNINKNIEYNSFSLGSYFDNSFFGNNSNDYEKKNNKVNENKKNKNKDNSTSEINKLISNIVKSEFKIKNEKKKFVLDLNKMRSSNFSKIPILFKTPTPSNKTNFKDFPDLINKLYENEETKRKNKRCLSSNINYIRKEKRSNSKIEKIKEDHQKNNQLVLLRKKKSFDLIKIKNPILSLYKNKEKNNTQNKIKFKNTIEFIIKSKSEEKNSFQNIINDFIKYPSKIMKAMEEYKNKKIMRKINRRKKNKEEFIPNFLKSINKRNSKIFLASEGFSVEIPGSPKLINKNIKRRFDVWNLKHNNSYNSSNNISSNYYYNPLFNSDENQYIEKTFLKYDNSFSSKSKSTFIHKFNNTSSKLLFKKRIMNNYYKRNNSTSSDFKIINLSEQKEKCIYLKNINI
jgi:hypothetical protein